MAKPLDPERLPRLRAAAQLLHRPASISDPVEVARSVAGVQAQDPYAARLCFRARSRRPTGADVDRARTEERSLLRTWAMRMTLHLIPTEDAGWMLPLFEPRIEEWSRRRLGQLGMPAKTQEDALRTMARMLDRHGPLTRGQLAARLEEEGVNLGQQRRTHIFLLATVSGIACLGPDEGKRTCFVRREDWLGEPSPFDRERSLAELARRYLRAFGPATDRDMAYWSGLPLGDVRSGLRAVAEELAEVRVGEETMLKVRENRGSQPRGDQVRMLGAFDTYLLGYRSREFAVPLSRLDAIKAGARTGGLIAPAVVVDGTVVATWRPSREGSALEISLEPFEPLPAMVSEAIEAEVEDIARFEGGSATLVETGAKPS